jgi:GNAT superfamily N-acetyltransferase
MSDGGAGARRAGGGAAGGASVRRAGGPADYAAFASLAREYYESLGVDLTFQNFESELAELPGCYAPPGGAILLASASDGALVGCVAVRPLFKEGADVPGTCEMKRLFVRAPGRGGGTGRALVAEALAAGRAAGYKTMVLDTLERLTAANAMCVPGVSTAAALFRPPRRAAAACSAQTPPHLTPPKRFHFFLPRRAAAATSRWALSARRPTTTTRWRMWSTGRLSSRGRGKGG